MIVGGCSTLNLETFEEQSGAVEPGGESVPTVPFVERIGVTLERRMRMQDMSSKTLSDGGLNTLHLYADGVVLAQLGSGVEAVEGRWAARGEDLCFTWPVRGRECWLAAGAVQIAQIETIRSDRGVVARMTRLSPQSTSSP